MQKTIFSEEVLRMQKTAGIITEGQFREALDSLNEDGLELKKIARDLYSWFKKQGIPVKIEAATSSGQMAKAATGKTMGDWMTPDEMEIAKTKGSARIFYYDDPKTKQTIIEMAFFGPVQGIQKVEKLFLQAYPNLEQYDRKLNQMSGSYNANLTFRIREKTTKKGGLAGNTPTKPAAQPQAEQ